MKRRGCNEVRNNTEMTCTNIHKLILNETIHDYLFTFSDVTDAADRGGA